AQVNDNGTPQAENIRRAARPYAVVVGVLFLAVIVFVSVNTISNKPIGLDAGDPAPKFAAPSATGTVDKDANVDPKKACGVRALMAQVQALGRASRRQSRSGGAG